MKKVCPEYDVTKELYVSFAQLLDYSAFDDGNAVAEVSIASSVANKCSSTHANVDKDANPDDFGGNTGFYIHSFTGVISDFSDADEGDADKDEDEVYYDLEVVYDSATAVVNVNENFTTSTVSNECVTSSLRNSAAEENIVSLSPTHWCFYIDLVDMIFYV